VLWAVGSRTLAAGPVHRSLNPLVQRPQSRVARCRPPQFRPSRVLRPMPYPGAAWFPISFVCLLTPGLLQLWRQPQLYPLDWHAVSNLHPIRDAIETPYDADAATPTATSTACYFQRALTAVISGDPGRPQRAGDLRECGNHTLDLFNRAAGAALPLPRPLDGGRYSAELPAPRLCSACDPLCTSVVFVFRHLQQSFAGSALHFLFLQRCQGLNLAIILKLVCNCRQVGGDIAEIGGE
jgi:hypothetical protein